MGYSDYSVSKERRKSGKASAKSSKSLQPDSKERRTIKGFDNQCHTYPFDSPRALRLTANLNNSAFATIYIDHHGHLQLLTSENLKERRSELFSPGFCNNFVRLCAQEAGDMDVNGDHDCLDSSSWGAEVSSGKDGKRRSSARLGPHTHGKPLSAKQRALWKGFREPCAQEQDPAYSSGESDSESDSEDSENEAAEYSNVFEYIKVGDQDLIGRQLHFLFDVIQQHDCKRIAKAWVKAVEPKKQAKYPYNGGDKAKALRNSPLLPINPGDLTRPPWWPETGCKHREPDHIGKQERLVLLKHILQKSSITKGFTYDKLKSSTDKLQGLQSRTKPLLNEVYDIQRHEEQLARGEIAGDMEIYVRVPSASSQKSKKARLGESKVGRRSTSQQPTTARSQSSTQDNTPISPKSESDQVIQAATNAITGISEDKNQLQLYDYGVGHPEGNHIPVNTSFGSSDSDDWQAPYDDSAMSPLTTPSTKDGAMHTPSSFRYDPLAAAQQFTIPDYAMSSQPRLMNIDPQEQPKQAQLSYSSGWPLPHNQAFVNRSNLSPERTQASSMIPLLLADNAPQIFQPPSQHPHFVHLENPQPFPMYSDRRSRTGYDSQSIMSMRGNPLGYSTDGLPYF